MISKINVKIINSMSLSELDVMRYIDNNKYDVVNMSIQELSKKAFVSTATIMRFCKKLNFSGFSELKYKLKEEIQNEENTISIVDYDNVLACNLISINETMKNVSKKDVENVVLAMHKASRIHFFGKGLSATILEYASKLLLTFGVSSQCYKDTHLAYIMAEKMNEDDILFVASLSGNTHQIVRMAQIAKSRNATVVTFTNNDSNELSKIGDYQFGVTVDGIITHPADISSRIPMLVILNIILTLYFGKMKK